MIIFDWKLCEASMLYTILLKWLCQSHNIKSPQLFSHTALQSRLWQRAGENLSFPRIPCETQWWLVDTHGLQFDYLLPQASLYAWRLPKQWHPRGYNWNLPPSYYLLKVLLSVTALSIQPMKQSNQFFLWYCKSLLLYTVYVAHNNFLHAVPWTCYSTAYF